MEQIYDVALWLSCYSSFPHHVEEVYALDAVSAIELVMNMYNRRCVDCAATCRKDDHFFLRCHHVVLTDDHEVWIHELV